jgi:hypothetical protein
MKRDFTLGTVWTARTVGCGVVKIHTPSENCRYILKVLCAVSRRRVVRILYFECWFQQDDDMCHPSCLVTSFLKGFLYFFGWWESYFQRLVAPKNTWFSFSWFLYLLTSWCRILFEKMLSLSLSKNIPLSYETRRFITVFTKSRHWNLS